MRPDDSHSAELARVYKRAKTSLRIHAFHHNGYLSPQKIASLNIPASQDVLEHVLTQLQVDGFLHIIHTKQEDIVYDFLPFLEKTAEENALDMAVRFQLASIYARRHMWTHAIAELRFTKTHPKFKKNSYYLLGQCFEQKGALEKARENYERLLAEDYAYADVVERLASLVTQGQQTTVISPQVTTVMKAVDQPLTPILHERYEMVRELGRGGAGIVYQAIDLKLKRDVALKVLYQNSGQPGDEIQAFLHEARLAAQLDHPNIIDIYDVNIDALCIAMELVTGGTLRTLLKKYQKLPIDYTRSVIMQLCRGLQVAHNAGVLHRDIKPANIFVTKRQQIKLGDFGIAHITAPSAQDAFTQISVQIGTLPYMSPEQVRGEQLTAASDVYAVGIVCYEMLTGTPPFTRGDIAYHHVYTPAPVAGISPSLDAIVLRCLAKNPAERFDSADELRQALQQQAKDEEARLGKYRELLKIALLDKDLSENERIILKLKRASLKISDQEARRIEKELGLF
jgi:hypothetical protein